MSTSTWMVRKHLYPLRMLPYCSLALVHAHYSHIDRQMVIKHLTPFEKTALPFCV